MGCFVLCVCDANRTRFQQGKGFYYSFLQNFTHNAFGFGETHKVPGSMICKEPPCTCLSYCFPRNTWRNVSHSKSFLIKINEIQKTSACGRKKERKIFFLVESGVYVFENKSGR